MVVQWSPGSLPPVPPGLADLDAQIAAIDARLASYPTSGIDLPAPPVPVLPRVVRQPVTGLPVSTEQDLATLAGQMGGSPGIVCDPGLARSTPCTRLTIDATKPPIIHSPGILGALDADQVALYCQAGMIDRDVAPDVAVYLSASIHAAATCATSTAHLRDPQTRLEAYFACLGRELGKRAKRP